MQSKLNKSRFLKVVTSPYSWQYDFLFIVSDFNAHTEAGQREYVAVLYPVKHLHFINTDHKGLVRQVLVETFLLRLPDVKVETEREGRHPEQCQGDQEEHVTWEHCGDEKLGEKIMFRLNKLLWFGLFTNEIPTT